MRRYSGHYHPGPPDPHCPRCYPAVAACDAELALADRLAETMGTANRMLDEAWVALGGAIVRVQFVAEVR